MASITINPLQQEQLIPFSFFRYHFSLNTPNFHYFPHPLTLLPLRNNRKISQDFVVRARTSGPKFSTLQRQPSINTKNIRSRNETGHGYSSAKSIDKRVSENTEKDRVNSAVEEKSKSSRHTRKTPSHNRQSYQSSKGYTHTSSGKSLEASFDSRVTEKIEKKDNENKAVKEKRVKSKKDRDSPEVKLRYDLDMCSKRGDVMGALSLYDTALREGIRLGQHHYTVLLYLCSSAAVGIVRPAKSGSGSRTSNTLAIANEVVNPLEFSGSTHKNDRDTSNSDRTVLNSDDKNLTKFSSGSLMQDTRILDNTAHSRKEDEELSAVRDGTYDQEDRRILVSEDVKKYALKRGFEIYENMRKEEVPMNEAALTSVARIAMSMGDGDMAFEMVKQMKILGINPRLRSYDPALFTFCNKGDVDKAFAVEKDMLENGVFPEEPELAALLRVSIAAGNSDKVYYVLHKLRTIVREISTSTEDLIINWFKSKQASRVGKRKWDKGLIKEVMENNGGGWHGQGWLGKGQWEVSHTTVSSDGICRCCRMRLATIDLDPVETEKFADSVASFAVMREKKSNFQKFQVRNLNRANEL